MSRLFEPRPSFPITVRDIYNKLKALNNESMWISQTTILKAMEQKVKLSYKKFSKANPKNFDYENVSEVLKSASLLLKLNHSFFEVLHIDEFSFDSRKTNYYGWGPKNSKFYISIIPKWFTIIFFFGLSIIWYYGVKGKIDSINSSLIVKYIKS